MPFFSSLLSILGTLLVPAPFVQIQPSLRPSESSLFQYASSMYSSSLACVTTIISTSTTSHSLLPPYPTCFARGLFGTGLWLNSLHLTGYGRLWSHLPYCIYLPLTFPLSYVQIPLTPMLELFWSRLSGLLHFLATNYWSYRLLFTWHNYSISDCEQSSSWTSSRGVVDCHVWFEDTTVCPVLTEWLSVVAPHLDLDSCILSGVATLHVSRLT